MATWQVDIIMYSELRRITGLTPEQLFCTLPNDCIKALRNGNSLLLTLRNDQDCTLDVYMLVTEEAKQLFMGTREDYVFHGLKDFCESLECKLN